MVGTVCLVLVGIMKENVARKEDPWNAQDTFAGQNSLQFIYHSSLDLHNLFVVVVEFSKFSDILILLFLSFLLQFLFELYVIWIFEINQISKLDIIFRVTQQISSTNLYESSQIKCDSQDSHMKLLKLHFVLITNHVLQLLLILVNDFVSAVVECVIAAFWVQFWRVAIILCLIMRVIYGVLIIDTLFTVEVSGE